MRRFVNLAKLKEFMSVLGRRASTPGTIYITGGSSALLLGIRDQTIDIDIKLDPEPEGVFEAISDLKISLQLNVELAAPDQFIPPLPGWEGRSQYIDTCGKIVFKHYDFYSQALAKIERGSALDLGDATALIARGLVEPLQMKRLFSEIRPQLIRYPALDFEEFNNKVEEFLAEYANN